LFKKKHIQALSDENLVIAFKKEAENLYLEELYGRYIKFVFLICMKYLKNEDLAKDLTMQVFEKLANDIRKFEIINFKSWLHVVSKNTCLMHIRSNKTKNTVTIDGEKEWEKNMEIQSDLHPNTDENIELKLTELENAVKQLEPSQQQCIDLFYLKEKSYTEVSEITGYSMNQVKSFIQNGKRNLKNILIQNGNFSLYVFAYLYFM
jgi:RNA polymerase sigma factor (sigma-70 family)